MNTGGNPAVSVVIPAYQAEATIGECLRGLASQSLARERYEIIVVDDGSRDGTSAVASGHAGVRVERKPNGGAASARNYGWQRARGEWIAFIDSDCVPSRGWLAALLGACSADEPSLGAAGKTLGLESSSEAARFAELIGSLDAERYLSHPRWPFAPSCNLMYRRDALAQCDGFDERFRTYEACDLHTRLRERVGGRFAYVPRAVVFHRHRASWSAYWRQQVAYGFGYAQFAMRRVDEIQWSLAAEARAWGEVIRLGIQAVPKRNDDADARTLRRGLFVKSLAQRIGFNSAYWRRAERTRWTA